MDNRQIAGSIKVAILTNAMGSEAAKSILDRLDKEERALVIKLQSKLGDVPKFISQKVAREFIEQSGIPLQIAHNSESNKKRQNREEKAEKSQTDPVSHLSAIQNIEPSQLLQLIKDEHPQTIAIILVHLSPNVSSWVLGNLPDEIKADVALRIASLNKVFVGMVGEIEKVFDEILKHKEQNSAHEAGGVGRLAEMLNKIDGAVVEQIIEGIEENNPEMAEKVKQMMFVFDDIVMVDDKGLQKVLRSVESKELSIALKASSDAVKQKLFSNMSQRAADILKEEIEVTGAVRMKDVTDAQQKITSIIRGMERKGELVIAGRGGEDFVR